MMLVLAWRFVLVAILLIAALEIDIIAGFAR